MNREFKIIRGADGEYFYDYVEQTPEVTKALASIKYYRLKSKSLADIEAAIKARSKGATPTTPVVSGGPPKSNNKGSASPLANGTGEPNPSNYAELPEENEARLNAARKQNALKNKSKPLLTSTTASASATPIANAENSRRGTYTPPAEGEVSDADFCAAQGRLRNKAISEAEKARREATIKAYRNTHSSDPDCASVVSPPPAVSSSSSSSPLLVGVTGTGPSLTAANASTASLRASGGKRKTKKSKRKPSKRKQTKRRK